MYYKEIKPVRALLRGFKVDRFDYNDFNEPCSNYLRVEINDRNFIVRGIGDKLKVIEVGLGENGISWKTIQKDIPKCAINGALVNIREGIF